MINSLHSETTIFPSWAAKFRDDPEVANRLRQISMLRERRAKGKQKVPHIRAAADFRASYGAYVSMRRAEAGRHDLPLDKAYHAHKLCIGAFTPVAHRAFWARWLYLERALELASRTGDLLFGAIILRTMTEDLWALLELSRLETWLNLDPDVPTHHDFTRIRRHGDLLWCRFLPPVQEYPELPESNPPQPFEGSE